MSRLRQALEAVNLPELIAAYCGPDAVRGLTGSGGLIHDPRPGHEEHSASFSVYKRGGLWRWKRHGGDEAGGSAYDFLLELGHSPEQAREELYRLAGLPSWGDWTPRPAPSITRSSLKDEARAALANCGPLSTEERARLPRLLAQLKVDDPAALDLKRRGLCGADVLSVHALRAGYRTRDGRPLALPGALALTVRGPDGEPWGVKIRNHGTKEEVKAAGLCRYVYRVAQHGAPAWCSPSYGHAQALLIVEGELNAAAASLAAQHAGLSLDVQGLAGAGGWPHLEGIEGRLVYLYTDGDEAGRACLERLGRLALELNAASVKCLDPLPDSRDFCDVLGEGVPDTLCIWLSEAFEAAPAFEAKQTAPDESRAQRTKNDLRQSGSAYQVGGWAELGGW